jgi:hypothetical protein
MAKETIVDKLILKLKEIQDDTLELAKPDTTTSGATSGATESTLPSVQVDEIMQPNIKISYSAIGAPVLMVDSKGKEQNVLDGEYKLATGKMLVVEGGKLKDIKDIPADEMSGTTGTTGTTKMSKVIIEVPEVDLSMAQSKGDQVKAALVRAGLDVSKAGSYCINITIDENGNITYGSFNASTYQDLMLAKEKEINDVVDVKLKEIEVAMAKQKENYEKVIKTLNASTKTIDAVPTVETEVVMSKNPTKTEILKAQIQAKKNN